MKLGLESQRKKKQRERRSKEKEEAKRKKKQRGSKKKEKVGTKRKEQEDVMAVNKTLISGSTTMLILTLLSEKDMYGYEMIETLHLKSNHVFDLKAGTLYPLLHGLEDKQYLESYEEMVGAKPRKYYHITNKGRGYLKEISQEWNEYARAVQQVIGGVNLEGI